MTHRGPAPLPVAGAPADLGGLCAALSRHRAHATVIVDAETDAVLRHAQPEAPGNTTLAVQRHVLAALPAQR